MYIGDNRGSFYPTLGLWHSIFIRFHNNIADQLSLLNPHWNDEKCFQETRRILTAVYQNIVYNEWLPYYIGKNDCAITGREKLPFFFFKQEKKRPNDAILVVRTVDTVVDTMPTLIRVIWTNLLMELFVCSTQTLRRTLTSTMMVRILTLTGEETFLRHFYSRI